MHSCLVDNNYIFLNEENIIPRFWGLGINMCKIEWEHYNWCSEYASLGKRLPLMQGEGKLAIWMPGEEPTQLEKTASEKALSGSELYFGEILKLRKLIFQEILITRTKWSKDYVMMR